MAVTACFPLPHRHTKRAGARFTVTDRAGRPIPGAVIHVYAGNIIGGSVDRDTQVVADSAGKAAVRWKRDWHAFLLLIPDAEAPEVFGWCAEAPGRAAQGGALEDEAAQTVSVSLAVADATGQCATALDFYNLKQGQLVADRPSSRLDTKPIEFAGVPVGAAPPSPGAADTPRAAWVPPASDTAIVDVRQLTLVAFHPFVSDSVYDADPDLGETMSDYAHYLGAATEDLRTLGVAIEGRVVGTLRFRAGERVWSWAPPRDGADLGCLFTDRDGRVRVRYGVLEAEGLVAEADSFSRGARRDTVRRPR